MKKPHIVNVAGTTIKVTQLQDRQLHYWYSVFVECEIESVLGGALKVELTYESKGPDDPMSAARKIIGPLQEIIEQANNIIEELDDV